MLAAPTFPFHHVKPTDGDAGKVYGPLRDNALSQEGERALHFLLHGQMHDEGAETTHKVEEDEADDDGDVDIMGWDSPPAPGEGAELPNTTRTHALAWSVLGWASGTNGVWRLLDIVGSFHLRAGDDGTTWRESDPRAAGVMALSAHSRHAQRVAHHTGLAKYIVAHGTHTAQLNVDEEHTSTQLLAANGGKAYKKAHLPAQWLTRAGHVLDASMRMSTVWLSQVPYWNATAGKYQLKDLPLKEMLREDAGLTLCHPPSTLVLGTRNTNTNNAKAVKAELQARAEACMAMHSRSVAETVATCAVRELVAGSRIPPGDGQDEIAPPNQGTCGGAWVQRDLVIPFWGDASTADGALTALYMQLSNVPDAVCMSGVLHNLQLAVALDYVYEEGVPVVPPVVTPAFVVPTATTGQAPQALELLGVGPTGVIGVPLVERRGDAVRATMVEWLDMVQEQNIEMAGLNTANPLNCMVRGKFPDSSDSNFLFDMTLALLDKYCEVNSALGGSGMGMRQYFQHYIGKNGKGQNKLLWRDHAATMTKVIARNWQSTVGSAKYLAALAHTLSARIDNSAMPQQGDPGAVVDACIEQHIATSTAKAAAKAIRARARAGAGAGSTTRQRNPKRKRVGKDVGATNKGSVCASANDQVDERFPAAFAALVVPRMVHVSKPNGAWVSSLLIGETRRMMKQSFAECLQARTQECYNLLSTTQVDNRIHDGVAHV